MAAKHRKHSLSLAERVERTGAELDHERWTSHALKTLRDSLDASITSTPLNVLCLGLGTPESSPVSRAQLSFLLRLCKSLNIEHSHVSLCDPVFSAADTTLLTQQGMHIAPPNVKDRSYVCHTPTLIYMPHCDMELHEDILRANWVPDLLCNLILICNGLADYVENNATHQMESRAPCVRRIVPFLQGHPLPISASFPSAFNSTSIQFVPSSQIDACSTEVLAYSVPMPGSALKSQLQQIHATKENSQ